MSTILTSLVPGRSETLHGASRRTYQARLYDLDAPPLGPGIYVFAGRGTILAGPGIYYIGEAQDIRTRVVPSHEKMANAKALGATHLLVIACFDEGQRKAVEADLIAFYRPPENVQGVNRLASLLG